MCDATLRPGGLRCTIVGATHAGFGHRFEAADAPDGRHDDNTEDDR